MKKVADALAAEGRKGYVIPGGGSNALGGLGYVACAQEMQQRFEAASPSTISSSARQLGHPRRPRRRLSRQPHRHADHRDRREPRSADQEPLVREAQAVGRPARPRHHRAAREGRERRRLLAAEVFGAECEDGRGRAGARPHRGHPARSGLHRQGHGRADRPVARRSLQGRRARAVPAHGRRARRSMPTRPSCSARRPSPTSGPAGDRSGPGADLRQHAPIGSRITTSASSSIAVGWSLTITMPAPARGRDRHHAGDRHHLQRRADGDQQIGLGGDRHRAVDDLGHQRLAERDRVALQDAAAALGSAGSASPARTRASASSIGARRPHCQHITRRIVPWTSTIELRRRAGALVQLVDVLRHERVQLAAPLERDERAVAGVRLGAPGRRVEARAPGRPPHLGFGEVVLDRRLLLGRRVLRPHAARPAEVGDAGLGRDAGAGEDDDAPGRVDETPCVRSAIAASTVERAALSSSRRAARGSPGSRASTCPA